MILIYVFGACVGFQIMLSTLIGYFANTFGLDFSYIDTIKFRAIVNFPMAIVFLIPISLLRDITSLAFASLLSLLSLTYTCILMYAELPFYNKEYRAKPNFVEHIFLVDWNFFTAASMCFFAFTC
jgi:amino acid permease